MALIETIRDAIKTRLETLSDINHVWPYEKGGEIGKLPAVILRYMGHKSERSHGGNTSRSDYVTYSYGLTLFIKAVDMKDAEDDMINYAGQILDDLRAYPQLDLTGVIDSIVSQGRVDLSSKEGKLLCEMEVTVQCIETN